MSMLSCCPFLDSFKLLSSNNHISPREKKMDIHLDKRREQSVTSALSQRREENQRLTVGHRSNDPQTWAEGPR